MVAGGFESGAVHSHLASAQLYDPATGTWTATGSLIGGRYGHTATLLANGKVVVAGGIGGEGSAGFLASAQVYDPATGIWTATGSLIGSRHLHTATLLPNGKVLVAGGQGDTVGFASAQIYDPATGTWTATGSLIGGRLYHTATLLTNGKVLVAGGFGDSGALLASAEVYDAETATSTVIVSSPNPAAVRSPITLTATVSPTPTGGTVSFTDNGAPITACQSRPAGGCERDVHAQLRERRCPHHCCHLLGRQRVRELGVSGSERDRDLHAVPDALGLQPG